MVFGTGDFEVHTIMVHDDAQGEQLPQLTCQNYSKM